MDEVNQEAEAVRRCVKLPEGYDSVGLALIGGLPAIAIAGKDVPAMILVGDFENYTWERLFPQTLDS
jgi:hypothetical protein